MIDHYDWPGGREAMIRFGPGAGPVVVAALPLFEEANRTRTFTVAILRALAERGVGGALPDLPGTGESLIPLEHVGLGEMREAFAAAARAVSRPYVVAIRSGGLVDARASAKGRWHLAPQGGPELLRELKRVRQLRAPLPPGDAWWADAVTEIAGNRVSAGLLDALAAAEPLAADTSPLRVVRLDSDDRPADLKLAGAPLWRRAEPDNDPALAEALAEDIAAWVRACAG